MSKHITPFHEAVGIHVVDEWILQWDNEGWRGYDRLDVEDRQSLRTFMIRGIKDYLDTMNRRIMEDFG